MGVGYPDWRRQSDKDSFPLLVNDDGSVLHDSQFVDGTFYVGLWDYVAFRLSANAGFAVTVRFEWYDTEALTTLLGVQSFVTSPTGGAIAQGRLLNMGPYLRIVWTPSGAVLWGMQRKVFVSNRSGAHIFVPQQPWLVNNAPNVAAGVPVATEFAGLAQGLMPIIFSIAAQPGQFTLEVLTAPTPTWVAFWTEALAANAFKSLQVPLPFGLVRVLMTNTGAGNVVMNARGAWPAGAS